MELIEEYASNAATLKSNSASSAEVTRATAANARILIELQDRGLSFDDVSEVVRRLTERG